MRGEQRKTGISPPCPRNNSSELLKKEKRKKERERKKGQRKRNAIKQIIKLIQRIPQIHKASILFRMIEALVDIS